MVDSPEKADLGAAESAIRRLVTVITQEPWALERADHDRARAAGLGDDGILQAILLSAYFNYLNRVADAVDIEFDYESALPLPDRDPLREPVPRPSRERWPTAPAFGLRLSQRPLTARAFEAWQTYVLHRDEPLSRRDRAVLVRAVAASLCDARTLDALGDAAARSPREEVLAAYAEVLTATPWRLTEDHLHGLRALGLDDRGLLDVISVASFQNTASRLRLALADSAALGEM